MLSPTRSSATSRTGRSSSTSSGLSDQELRDVDKVFVVACGSAYHSGLLAKYAIEHWTRLPVEGRTRQRIPLPRPGSRSLDACCRNLAVGGKRPIRSRLSSTPRTRRHVSWRSATPTVHRSRVEADAVLYTRAGPEIAVASTKAFLAQVTANYLVGLALAQARGTKYPDEVAREYADLEAMPALVSKVLETAEPVRALAPPVRARVDRAVPGASRRPTRWRSRVRSSSRSSRTCTPRALPAGELKHGPIALIEEDLPVIIVMPSPQGRAVLHSKLVSNIQEIKARGATTIVIAEEGDTVAAAHADHLIEIPASPTLLQPVAVHGSVADLCGRGCRGAWLRRRQAA